jgi:hypothetical protein
MPRRLLPERTVDTESPDIPDKNINTIAGEESILLEGEWDQRFDEILRKCQVRSRCVIHPVLGEGRRLGSLRMDSEFVLDSCGRALTCFELIASFI